MARENNSVGSRDIFFSSAAVIAALCLKNAIICKSTEPLQGMPGLPDFAVAAAFMDSPAAIFYKHIVERGPGAYAVLEFQRAACHADAPLMHDCEFIAEIIRFLHIMCGQQNGHAIVLP